MSSAAAGKSSLAFPRFVSVRELAQRLSLNEFTVYHWAKSSPERLPRVTRFHGRVLFIESDVQAWFDSLHSEQDTQEAMVAPLVPPVSKRKPGRPKKAEQLERQRAAQLSAAVSQ